MHNNRDFALTRLISRAAIVGVLVVGLLTGAFATVWAALKPPQTAQRTLTDEKLPREWVWKKKTINFDYIYR